MNSEAFFHHGENCVFIFKDVSDCFFSRCICGLLKKKPRILVTHQLQYLKAADEIVVLKEVFLYASLYMCV